MNKRHLLLIAILAFAAFLRLYQLESLPISLFGDEVDVGYHAWSLATTGRDYMGNLLPAYIHSFSEWRAPLLMYVTAPITLLLGLSALSVRLPSALLGILNIYLIYLLARLITKNQKVSLLSAFLLTISPWHIHYSRAAFEVTLLTSLILVGCLTFVKGRYYLSLIPFALTFYTYSTANIFTPLLLVCLVLIYKPKITPKRTWFRVLPTLLLLLPIIYLTIFGPVSNRFSNISIFSDQKAIDQIILSRTEPWALSPAIEKIFHNKATLFFDSFTRNYLTAFSPDFLFLKGDPNFRHSVGEFGELPLFFVPLLILGIHFLFKTRSTQESKLLLAWLLISPIPASLTQDGGNHATRLFVALPPLILVCSLGAQYLSKMLSRKVTPKIQIALFLSISLIFIASYWHRYSVHYRNLSARNWQFGFDQTFKKLLASSKANIYINNTYEPSLLKFLLFTKFPPAKFQKEFSGDETKTAIIPGFDGFRLGDHLYFGSLQSGVSISEFLKPGETYVASQRKEIPGNQDWSKETPPGLETISVTYDLLSDPLFTITRKK